jgi:hypothetical protein
MLSVNATASARSQNHTLRIRLGSDRIRTLVDSSGGQLATRKSGLGFLEPGTINQYSHPAYS